MKKLTSIAAAVVVAGGVTIGTAVPASAIPRATKVGQACQIYKEERHPHYSSGGTWLYKYKLLSDDLTRCRYFLDKKEFFWGVVINHETSYPSFNKYRY